MLTVVPGDGSGHEGRKDSSPSLIDEIVREGARRMLAEALQAEVDAYIARFAGERDEQGRRVVIRNGYHQSREVLTSAGAVEVTVPRVNDKRADPATGERMRFSSAILPPWARKTPKITEVLPLLYLHGLSSGDFVPALGQFLGSSGGPPAHDEPDRIDVRDGKAPDQDHQGPRLACRRARQGVQADRVGPGPVARRQRAASRRPGPCRRGLRQRQARRAARRGRPA